jgi:GNAT superfamily N-acetyltransferase
MEQIFVSQASDLPLEISSDKIQLDIPVIHQFLTHSYWARGIEISDVEKSIEHSMCIGAYIGMQQVGFARLITDYTTFGYLADVFVLEAYRGQGIASAMISWLLEQPETQQLRRILLATKDAHPLYSSFSFSSLKNEEVSKFMQLCPAEDSSS